MAVVTVVLGAGAASASAETITFDVPIAGPVVNACTGETFYIDGTQHMKVTGSTSATGFKSQAEANLTGVTGTTLTGVRYVMNDQTSTMDHEDFDPFAGDVQFTTETSTIMNRQGQTDGVLVTDPGDDWRLHVMIHFTVVNGVPTADKTDLRADCQ